MTTQTLTLAQGLNAGLRQALADDDHVVLLGEDIGALGGVFRVTDGLQREFGPRRVVDTPLAESGILGTAIGMSYRGYRPVVEIQFDGFVYVAFDQIVSQVAKMHARTRGKVPMPITIRIPVAGGIGAAEHHSESPETYFVHTAGLRVVSVSNPQDASTVLRQAIACDDPVIFFEPKRLYHVKGEVDAAVDLADAPPMSAAHVVRPGRDVTVVSWGSHVATAIDAAEAMADDGASVEVIDLRSLSPWDADAVAESVRRTGRLVVVHEGPRQVGVGAEICATVTERCFEHLEAPPVRVTGHDVPYPPAKLEGHHVPDLDRVCFGIDQVLGRVPLDVPTVTRTAQEVAA
ncbi:pyruvate dehydrogenase E1 component beta subunit [Isoptericola sp. CG 20/1183]|uniref:Pyruvate dehydrogenase E1 component beta subunit n=1 Tax=Isoptericola halotolerans TaxID=300560 RepID=A0ABX5EIU9_9MICO|nr:MULTISPECIES: alpha-ketoacid dehydrogenase subunit beta [Isoptericola]PRZ09611.1 pyruvate dehydrogenase E1 component beta subunit [Isoptericola sp. CG 20/1183]PRZ10412.1 pyruvate dehydrogenase E1 component beta subunit [Isoptericola halotolerans]